jgi:hypothetical protein
VYEVYEDDDEYEAEPPGAASCAGGSDEGSDATAETQAEAKPAKPKESRNSGQPHTGAAHSADDATASPPSPDRPNFALATFLDTVEPLWDSLMDGGGLAPKLDGLTVQDLKTLGVRFGMLGEALTNSARYLADEARQAQTVENGSPDDRVTAR